MRIIKTAIMIEFFCHLIFIALAIIGLIQMITINLMFLILVPFFAASFLQLLISINKGLKEVSNARENKEEGIKKPCES